MSHIVDALQDADFDASFIPDKPIVPYLLTDHSMLHTYQRDLDRLCTRGLYILDDDVLECMVGIKIYFRNYVMFAEMLEGYEPYGKKHNIAEVAEPVEKIFYQHIAVICGEDYMSLVEELQQCIHKKRTQLHFERSGKNFKKVRRRMRLRNKILDQSNLVRCLHNEFILLGMIMCQELGLDPDEEQKEMNHWVNYLAKVMGLEE